MQSPNISNESNPILKSNFFSKWLYCWIAPLLSKGYKTPLLGQDLYNLVEHEESKYLSDQLNKEWQKELLKLKNQRKPSLLLALFRIWYLKFLLNSVLVLFEETLRIVLPLVIVELIKYFSGSVDFNTTLVYGALLAVGILFASLVHHPYVNNSLLYGMRLRVSLTGLAYKETFKQKSSSQNVHMLHSLVSTEAARLERTFIFLPYFIIAPLQAIFVAYIMLQQIGAAFVAGLVLLICFVSVQTLLRKLYAHIKNKQAVVTERRTNFILEIVSAIKVIKMHCWEEAFENTVKSIRMREMKYQASVNSITAFNSLVENDLCCLLTFTSIVALFKLTNIELKMSYVVLGIAFYSRLSCTLGFWLNKAVICTSDALTSLQRFQAFLSEPKFNGFEIDTENKEPNISISQMSSEWTKNVSIELNCGELLVLAGPTGTGKSLFIHSILNEVPRVKGSVKVTGRVFYVAQKPWLFPATVRDNILFGKPHVKEKFDLILKCCFLVQDVRQLAHGENTMIGDKGAHLSAGQSARVCLARALYSDADIYLLDGPLSALDSNVSSYLYERCIEGYLKNKIRILVTHDVQHLARADKIMLFDKEKVLAQGTYDEIASLGLDLKQLLDGGEKKEECDKGTDGVSGARPSAIALEAVANRFLVTKNTSDLDDGFEEQKSRNKRSAINSIMYALNKNAFFDYFKAGSGHSGGILVILLFMATQSFIISADYYVANWATFEESYFSMENTQYNLTNNFSYSLNQTSIPGPIRNNEFIKYTILVSSAFTFIIFRSVIYLYLQTKSSIKYHDKILNSITSTYLRFFDLNPIGRITSRFSRDIGIIDEQLAQFIFEFLQMTMIVVGFITFSVFVNYWILAAVVPLFFVCFYLRNYFLITLKELKRLEGFFRSPISVHVNNTLDGMLTIRACKNNQLFCNEFDQHMNNYTKVCSSTIHVQRWFQCRLDLISALFAAVAIFSSILGRDYFGSTSGQVGLLLTYILNLTPLFRWLMVQNCEISSLMASVERINEYVNLEKEPLEIGETRPDNDWPACGEILFDDVSLAYAKNLPTVLRELSFEIYPREKVGVVGQTGAGKSSLIHAIFRLTEPVGSIYIDGIDIKKISLKELRKNITIVPQEPVLFEGTIRSNLDPFNKYDEDNIWNALEQVQLKQMVQQMKNGLDSIILSGGKNVDAGEKQLMCLARAIIKKSKIIIIDDATSNVDYEVDALVQRAIKECFRDCTVFTITNRINAIIDSNRIMCFNAGKLVSLGSPYDLLISSNFTVFKSLVKNLGKTEAARLTEMARLSKLDKENEPMVDKCDLTYEIEEVLEEREPFLKKNLSIDHH